MSWFVLTTTIIVVVTICAVIGFKKTVLVFLSPKENESLSKKGIKTGLAATSYSIYHYWVLIPVATTIVIGLLKIDMSYCEIFVVMWALNALNGWIIVKINNKAKEDFTLQEGTRRTVDEVKSAKKIPGILLEMYNLLKVTLLDGPGDLFIFLRPKLKNHKVLAVIVFLIAAGFQMILWTIVYIKGYEKFKGIF